MRNKLTYLLRFSRIPGQLRNLISAMLTDGGQRKEGCYRVSETGGDGQTGVATLNERVFARVISVSVVYFVAPMSIQYRLYTLQ